MIFSQWLRGITQRPKPFLPAPTPTVEAGPRDPMSVREMAAYPGDIRYRTPDELSLSPTRAMRGLVIGSCLSELLPHYLNDAFPAIATDHILYNNAGALPAQPPHPLGDYDFQVIMLPLRTAMPESLYMRLRYDDVAGHETAFHHARLRMSQMLHGALMYRAQRPITTFVTNFTVAQQNPLGRLQPRYDLRNPVYFVEQLNRALAEEIADLAGVHLVDVDQISGNFGRKYLQDDLLTAINHGSLISDHDVSLDRSRLEPPVPISQQFAFRVHEFILAMCHEIGAMYRTLRQLDPVKLVIVDLDDTLWRGVIAEDGYQDATVTEGWPIGLVEALLFLKKRGVLLAIASKNDEARIRTMWPTLYGNRLELNDFVSIKINWETKSENVETILREVNLLPRNVVFIDDNPVERASITAAFPEMRTLGATPYQMRRVLLWSSETQVATVSTESVRRTEMVQAQIVREQSRSRLTRGEFLATLGVRVRLFELSNASDQNSVRAFELLNKSNQFNTTGTRWTQPKFQSDFGGPCHFWVFEVEDRFTQYGLVGVIVVEGDRIAQFVMSCRVVGLEVEIAVITALAPLVTSAVVEATEANFMCRDLYLRCGYGEQAGTWQKPLGTAPVWPSHIPLFLPEARAATMAG